MERDTQRVLRPGPAVGKSRSETVISDDAKRVTDVCEPFVDEVDDLRGSSGLQECWYEDVGIATGRDCESAAGVATGRLGSNAPTHERCAKDPSVSHRRHVQSSFTKWGTRSSASRRTPSSGSSVASESSRVRTASNIAFATSSAPGARPSTASSGAGAGIDSPSREAEAE